MLRSPIVGKKGSALLNVLIFAALMMVLVPIMMDFYKQNSKATAFNRDILTKNLNFASIGNYSYSPAALYASYLYSSWPNGGYVGSATPIAGAPWANNAVQNSCYRLCLGGRGAIGVDSNAIVTGSCDTTAGAAGTACKSREADTTPAWHLLSLYHPTWQFQLMAGPDPRTPTVTTPSTQKLARFTLDGYPCQYSPTSTNADNNCPFTIAAWFHPICAGDVWLLAAPPRMASQDPNSILIPGPTLKKDELTRDPAAFPAPSQLVAESNWKPMLWPAITNASALTPKSCAPQYACMVNVNSGNGCSTPTAPYVSCPTNPCVIFDPSWPDAVNVCCGNHNCPTATATSVSTATGTGCDLGAAFSTCETACSGSLSRLNCNGGGFECKCNNGSTIPHGEFNMCCVNNTGTVASTNTDTTIGTGSNTGSYVYTCAIADSIMVWYQISWATVAPWNTNRRWAGFKTLDNLRDPLGNLKNVGDIPQTKVCALFSSASGFPNMANTCP